jgi:hypothetical protein
VASSFSRIADSAGSRPPSRPIASVKPTHSFSTQASTSILNTTNLPPPAPDEIMPVCSTPLTR